MKSYKSFLNENNFLSIDILQSPTSDVEADVSDVTEQDLIEYIKMLDESEYENVMALLEGYDEDVFSELSEELDEELDDKIDEVSSRHFKKRKNVVKREKKQNKAKRRQDKIKRRKDWRKKKNKSSTKRQRKLYKKAIKRSGGKRGIKGKIVKTHR